MKKKGKWIAAVLAIAMLAGCGSAPSESGQAANAENTQSSDEVKTLEFFWFADGDETASMRKVLDAYEAENPNIKVELVEVPYDDLNDKLMMAISGGEPPALARVTQSMYYNEVALDLADTFGGVDAFFENYPASFRDANTYYKDKLYAVPADCGVTGMFYNKTAFEQAGVEVPQSEDEIWTWDEFTEKLKIVVQNSDVQYGFAIDCTAQRWSNILYQFGGKYLNEDGSPAFSSEEALNALNFTKQNFDDGTWVKSVWLGGEDPSNLFMSGQLATYIAGSWKLPAFKDIEDFEWGVTYMPYDTQRAAISAYKMFVGFEGSGVEEETKDLLKYLASEKASSYYQDSLFISPRLDDADMTYESGSEMFAIFSQEQTATPLQASFDMNYPDWYTGLSQTIVDDLCAFVAGDITAEEVMANIDAKTAEVLVGD